MNANLYTYPRQSGDTNIFVVPAHVDYADQMERCHQIAYGYTSEYADEPESLTAAKFRQHLEIFPEGQFMALDTHTEIVVGTSTNLRLNVDLLKHDVRSWAEITGDG